LIELLEVVYDVTLDRRARLRLIQIKPARRGR